MSGASGESVAEPWRSEPPPWGRADLLAALIWTAAIVAFFHRAVLLREAFFYFDITEINYPYRAFFAGELRQGRFSRWFPGLYSGMPLFSESQVGYLHPLKYLLYPWLETWQAFNLDTVLSVWLTGIGAYGWLRRHVAPCGALTGAAVFGLSGFVWAHLIHTSMANALASVPFVVWATEWAWDRGRPAGIALAALALAFQVFAGHLQDTLLTGLALGVYALFRAATEATSAGRLRVLGVVAGVLALGVALAAVQWMPSKELLDRSPRAGGLSWDELTYGSWNPELLPTLVVREAYGTRARDTDWMDGFYPYHEMNAYMGLTAMALAVIGAGAARDRWVAFWIVLAVVGSLLMLGRFTFLMDMANRIPVLGSSRIPVRFHLWVSLATAALAAVGVDRLERGGQGRVHLRAAGAFVALLVVASIPILVFVYWPAWANPGRWNRPYHLARYGWLARELTVATTRTAVVSALGALAIATAARGRASRPGRSSFDRAGGFRVPLPARPPVPSTSPNALAGEPPVAPGIERDPRTKTALKLAACWALPLIVIADLLGAHWFDAPTIDPGYWTSPPASAKALKAAPSFIRMMGLAEKSAGEPGYASEPVDFFSVRDTLDWSLPPVWGLLTSTGESPMIPKRIVGFADHAAIEAGRLDIESVTHVVTGPNSRFATRSPPVRAGQALIWRNSTARPRARIAGHPYYCAGEAEAVAALDRLGPKIRDRLVVEDPAKPLDPRADVSGSARIVREEPERVAVAAETAGPAYLVLADTFDPGWTATIDGKAAPIRPAWVQFRAVFLPGGRHTVVFRYRPVGFLPGLIVSLLALLVATGLLAWPRKLALGSPAHATLDWPPRWPRWLVVAAVITFVVSIVRIDPAGGLKVSSRWHDRIHQFTWGAGIEAMRLHQSPSGRRRTKRGH